MDAYVLNTDTVAVVSSVTKTVAQIATPSTQRVKIISLSVAFDGAASAKPAKVDLLRQTTSGTATSATPLPLDPNAPASLTTCTKSATVEPTAGVVLYSWYVTPNGGLFNINFVSGEEPVIDESDRMGVRITSNSDCNAIVTIGFLE
jgi:hypothetical protein